MRKRERKPIEEVQGQSIGFRRRQEKRARAEAVLAGKPLIAAFDLAKKKHAVWLAGRDLVPICRFVVSHSHDGLGKFLERAERVRAEGGFDRILVFMEATSHYWANVANWLEARGIEYHTVAPLAVDRQREIEHLTHAKGDYRDAELIHRLGATGQWLARLLERDRLWLQLDVLAREHEALLALEVAERNRVRSLLELVLPEMFECFNAPLGKTARALLRQLSNPPTEIPETFAALIERVTQVHGHRIRTGKLRTLAAKLEATPSFGVERALSPVLARVGLAVDRLDLFAHQRKGLRARLVALYEETPYRKFLNTIPGVLPENHALVLGLIGDPKRYDRSTCLVKLAGTEPRENESGKAEGSHSISHRGRSPLRHVVHRIVLGFQLGSNDEFRTYMKRLMERDQNPLRWPAAAVATGNKYLRLVYRLSVDGKPYDSTKLCATDA
jgi:transposase